MTSFERYMSKYPSTVGLSWEEFILLGKADPKEDHFNMSYLACNLSQGINGVSKLHGDVSKEVLKPMYKRVSSRRTGDRLCDKWGALFNLGCERMEAAASKIFW